MIFLLKHIIIILIGSSFILLFFIPFITFLHRQDVVVSGIVSQNIAKLSPDSEKPSVENALSKDVVTLYDASTGRKTIMPLREYLYGALISEMPAAYGEEALKAQALCCKTAAARKALDFQGSSQEDADGADIEIYSACNIGYVSPRPRRPTLFAFCACHA